MTTENNGMYMPVAPAYGGNGGFGLGDQGAWWIIILLAILWGNNGYGFGGGGNQGDLQRGFDQATLTNGISGIQNAITQGFANAEVAANGRQMADMLAHALKSLATYYAMKGEDYEMDGQSGRRGRNPMNGRYMSRDNGYSGGYDYGPDANTSGYVYRPDPRQMPRW